jgi:predicted ATPase
LNSAAPRRRGQSRRAHAQAGLTELAINYLRKAGQRANESSANAEAIGHLKLALELLQSLPDGPEHKRKALELHVMLAQAMIAGRGYAASETREVLLQARALTDERTEVLQKCSILYGIWASYYVAGEVAMQQKAALEFLAEAERHDETDSLCLSHRTLGTTYVQMGEFAAGRQHLERARELYDPVHHSQSKYFYGQDIGATALSYLCWALWHLGHLDQAGAVAAEAKKRAEALSHPFTLQASGRAAADEIENPLIKSLETARRQQALSWQLRTACDLARLRQGQGRGDEALTLLQSIYDQFTEGFGTADLIHARTLLEGLRANSVDKVAKDQSRADAATAD